MDRSDPVVTAKQALRETALRARRSLTPAERVAQSAQACERLLQLPELGGAETVLAYCALTDECDPGPAVLALRSAGVRVVLPRVVGAKLEVALAAGSELVRGPFGILEPVGPALAPSMIDVAIVPGVAFDRVGGRLGHGHGFYDRLLPRFRADTLRVGIAFSCQMAARVARDGHDQAVDVVVTNAALHRISPPPLATA